MSDIVTQPVKEEPGAAADAPAVETLDFNQFETFRQTGKLPEAAKETPSAPPAKKPEGKTEGTSDTPKQEPLHGSGEEEERQPLPKGIQKRFDKITREKHELRNRLTLLERQLAEAGPLNGSAKKTEAAAATSQKKETPKPDPDEPKLEDFDSYEEHQKALIDHRVERRLKDHEDRQSQASAKTKAAEESARIQKHIAEQLDAVREKYEDFDEVFAALDDDLALDEVTGLAVAESESTGELLYYFGQNPEEVGRLAALSPARRAAEVGKIEARLVPDAGESSPQGKQKPKSKAPAPITPVRAGSSPKTPSLDDPDLDFTAFERLRAKK